MNEEIKSNKLKPCPFCLSDKIQIHSDGGCVEFRVHCHNCNCSKYPLINTEDSEESAIMSWNKRLKIEI